MPLEIERKFKVISDEYLNSGTSSEIKQIYLSVTSKMSIRIRIDDMHASIAIKYKVSDRVNREYEYNIPIDEARSIMNLEELPIISKTRYLIDYKGYTWEVDKFHAENDGLVIAEIELEHENDFIEIPPWIGEEITADYRYLNSNLAINPFSKW